MAGSAVTTLSIDLDELTRSIRDWVRELPPRRRPRSGITRVVAVAGAPGLGKTTVCRALADLDQSACVLDLDGYLFERPTRRRLQLSGFDLDSYEYVAAMRDMRDFLSDGLPIHIRPYLRTGLWGEPIRVAPSSTVILDGNIAQLCPEIRALVDGIVFFIANTETMHFLRVDRDVRESRFSAEEAERIWHAEWPALRDNLLPAVSAADLIVEPTLERNYWIHERRDGRTSGVSIGLFS